MREKNTVNIQWLIVLLIVHIDLTYGTNSEYSPRITSHPSNSEVHSRLLLVKGTCGSDGNGTIVISAHNNNFPNQSFVRKDFLVMSPSTRYICFLSFLCFRSYGIFPLCHIYGIFLSFHMYGITMGFDPRSLVFTYRGTTYDPIYSSFIFTNKRDFHISSFSHLTRCS